VAGPLEGFSATLIFTVVQVFAIVVVFSDFAIVFEDIGAVAGLRRSVRLVGLRLGPVLLIYVVLFLALTGVRALYTLYFDGAARVFVLLPISHMLVESLILLLGTLALIFLYEDLRRRSPA
jgi:hypothetical protein